MLASQYETDLSSPQFDAARFLAVIHASTRFTELQVALTELRKTTSDKTVQLKALVSAYYDQYLSCHEAVRVLATDVSVQQQETEKLVADMKNLNRVVEASLAAMLERGKDQRRIRHTLAVLARSRLILGLTSKMKASLSIHDYDTLAVDYTRLKYQSSKIINLPSPLKRIVAAGRDIAAYANIELLRCLENALASVGDQKRAINLLTTLGFEEKPMLVCLAKQCECLERRLEVVDDQNASQFTSEEIMEECVSIVSRFRNGLWGFLCDMFEAPDDSASATNAITSVEAEHVQFRAWNILSKCIGILKYHAAPPSALRLKILTGAFYQLRCCKRCPNAATLNANIEHLNESFCSKFRTTITLDYLNRVCQSTRFELLAEYFEPVVTVHPSFSSEIVLGASATTPVAILPNQPTKIQRVLVEARQAFDVIKKASTISSESKVLVHRASVFTIFATDILQRWKIIWENVELVLLDVLDIANCDIISTASSTNVNVFFRTQLLQTLEKHLREMLSEFLDKLVAAFVAEISPLVPAVESYAAGEVKRNRCGARACILLAIVANCVEVRENCLRIVDGWMAQLKYGDIGEAANISMYEHGRATASGTRSLLEVVQNVEIKCIEIYSSTHAEPLQRILQAGAAEEPLLPNFSCSSDNSCSDRSGSGVFPFAANSEPSTSMLSDPRQYVFNVLLQLITVRSEIETGVGSYPQCWEYVRSVTDPLTAALAEFLQSSLQNLKNSNTSTSTLEEWKRSHLLIETRFFQLALSDIMAGSTKNQFGKIEEQLIKVVRGEHKIHARQLKLLNQMKLQTKLYLLAIQQ